MASTSFSRMIKVLAIVCLGLFSKVEAQSTHMGVEFMLQFPYMPEGQPILMMYSTTINRFDVYITAPKSRNSVFERVVLTRLQVTSYTVQRKYLTPTSSTTTSIVAKGKFQFGMTVFMAISFHSAASFLAIPVSGWGAEYFVLVPKKEAYVMQNCTGRTVGEQPLGFTPVKITALYSFGVIVGSCEEYEFESECRRMNVKTAGGVTAEILVPSRTWGKQFVTPIALKKLCEQYLRFLTPQPNTVILVTRNEQTRAINVVAGGVLETYRLNSQTIVYVKASSQIMMYNDYHYPLVMVVPVELFMNEYIWSTPSARGYAPSHYMSIVAPIDNFFLVIDKVKISLKWKRDAISRWQTSFSRLEPGTHYMSSLTGVPFGLYILGRTPDYQFIHPAGFYITDFSGSCEQSAARYNDGMDNDCDGFIDEERENLKDDDLDGLEDEDMASYTRTWHLGILFLSWSQNKMLKIFLVLVLFSSTSTTAAEVPPSFPDNLCERVAAEHPEYFEMHLRTLREKNEKLEQELKTCMGEIEASNTAEASTIYFTTSNVIIGGIHLFILSLLSFCSGIYIGISKSRNAYQLSEGNYLKSIQADLIKHRDSLFEQIKAHHQYK